MKKPVVKPIAMQATLSTFIGRIQEENKGVLGLTLTPACPGRVVAVSDAQLVRSKRNNVKRRFLAVRRCLLPLETTIGFDHSSSFSSALCCRDLTKADHIAAGHNNFHTATRIALLVLPGVVAESELQTNSVTFVHALADALPHTVVSNDWDWRIIIACIGWCNTELSHRERITGILHHDVRDDGTDDGSVVEARHS
jgi:hypothetical protein